MTTSFGAPCQKSTPRSISDNKAGERRICGPNALRIRSAVARHRSSVVSSCNRRRFISATEVPDGSAPSYAGFSRVSSFSWSSAVMK